MALDGTLVQPDDLFRQLLNDVPIGPGLFGVKLTANARSPDVGFSYTGPKCIGQGLREQELRK